MIIDVSCSHINKFIDLFEVDVLINALEYSVEKVLDDIHYFNCLYIIYISLYSFVIFIFIVVLDF